MAAAEAAKFGVHVTLVDKGLMGRSGSSPTADMAMSAAFGHTSLEGDLGKDSIEQHYEDTMRRGEWLNDPALVAIMVREALPLLEELETFGVRFSRTAEGLLFQYRTLGHTYARCCSPIGGGHKTLEMMRKEVLHRRVEVRENIFITRILLRGGEVCGAYGLDIESGGERIFTCKAAVIATGGATRLYPYTSASFHTTGDGFLLGLEAGAELANMEFVEFTVIPKVGLRIISSSGITPFMGRGSMLFNARGERFLTRWDPEQLERTTRAVLARAIYKEWLEGRGPVYNDTSRFTPEIWDEFEMSQGQALHKLRAAGIEPRRERFEWVPAAHTFLGGIVIDGRAGTGVPGLFASGETTNGFHGANRLSDNAISECLVFGKRSGRFAAKHAKGREAPEIPPSELGAERERLRGQFSDAGEDPRQIEKHIRNIAWRTIGVVRNGKDLREGVSAFQEAQRTPLLVRGTAELLVALEARHIARVGEIAARAALRREESRGQHFREDFPEKRGDWRRILTVRAGSGGLIFGERPVPESSGYEAAAL